VLIIIKIKKNTPFALLKKIYKGKKIKLSKLIKKKNKKEKKWNLLLISGRE
jgi:hypothetical protein